MRKFSISCLSFIIVLLSSLPAYSYNATVIKWDTRFMDAAGGSKAKLLLGPGMVVTVDKTGGEYSLVNYNGDKGWVKTRNIASYISQNPSVKSKPLLSGKIFQENDNDYLFYYKDNRLYKLNATDRVVESSQKIKDITDIYPSTRNGLFLLEGVTTNSAEGAVHHLHSYEFTTGKTAYIGSFPERNVSIESVEFIKNSEYVAVILMVDDRRIACLYRMDNGELMAYSPDTMHVTYLNGLILLNNRKYFWYYEFSSSEAPVNIGFDKNRKIVDVKSSWIISGVVDSKSIDNEFLISTKAGVISLDLRSKKSEQTPYKSLLFNQNKTLNFYVRGEYAYLKNLKTDQFLSDFQGVEPKVNFVAFAKNNIICRAKYERLDTLFLYNDQGNEIYRYKAIDEPMAINDDGLLAELNFDKDLLVITLENPIKKEFYFIFDKGDN